MDNDFNKELIEYLDKKFTGIDEKFVGIDKRFEEVDKKFVSIDKRFDEVDNKFDRLFDVFATKEDFQEMRKEMMTQNDKHQLLMSTDNYARKADTFFQELVALSNQTRRHEKWIAMLAEKLNVKLEY